MKLNYRLPRCNDCGKTATPRDIYRLIVNSKTNAHVDFCKDCLPKHYMKFLKDSKLGEDAKNTKYWKDGAREIDFKSYVEKWIKNL